jgi:hypothetical protein
MDHLTGHTPVVDILPVVEEDTVPVVDILVEDSLEGGTLVEDNRIPEEAAHSQEVPLCCNNSCLLACLLTLDFLVLLGLVLLKCYTDLRYNKKDIPRRPLKLPKFEPNFYSESNTQHFRLSIFMNPCFPIATLPMDGLSTCKKK